MYLIITGKCTLCTIAIVSFGKQICLDCSYKNCSKEAYTVCFMHGENVFITANVNIHALTGNRSFMCVATTVA